MPTAAERSGDLSQTLNQLGQPVVAIDPATGAPFPGNIIPVTSHLAAGQGAAEPLPAAQFQSRRTTTTRSRWWASPTRTAYRRASTRCSTSEFAERQLGLPAHQRRESNLFRFVDDNRTTGMNLNLSWRHTFNKTLYGTAGAQYSRFIDARHAVLRQPASTCRARRASRGNNQEPANWGPPSLNFSSGFAGAQRRAAELHAQPDQRGLVSR